MHGSQLLQSRPCGCIAGQLKQPVLPRRTQSSARRCASRIQCISETGPVEASDPQERTSSPQASTSRSLDKEFAKFARGTAGTFAPRSSGPTKKNPAYKGSALYTVFEAQAWLSLVVGGLLSYNVIFPTDQPSIARLLGMWSIWMMTVPSLRARECTSSEKDALNILFLVLPLINITLPFVWKSFAFIFTADVAAMAGVYAWKLGLPKLGDSESLGDSQSM